MKVTRPRPLVDDVLVSVVVPCYNYGHFLAEAVGSALGQKGVRVEVLIVDDASTDNTPEIAERLAQDPRVRLLTHERNRGHIQTYNDGLEAASGDHVTLLSADDLLAPGALARAAALLEHEDVGMVYGLPLGFEDARPKPRHRPESWTVWQGQQWLRALCWRGRNFIMSPEVVVRGEVAREVGGYNPALPHSADLEYWIRVAARAGVGRVNGPAQAYYRDHAANMHLTEFATMPVDLTHRLAAFKVLDTPEVSERVVDAGQLLQRARKAMAFEALGLARRGIRDGSAAGEMATYLSFAAQTWAPSAESAAAARLPRTTGWPPRAAPVVRGTRKVTEHLRWRLWAEAGLR